MENIIRNDKKENGRTITVNANMIFMTIGAVLICIGLLCILIKANTFEYIDADGLLHENFFLLPIGFFFIFSGIFSFVLAGIKNIMDAARKHRKMSTDNLR